MSLKKQTEAQWRKKILRKHKSRCQDCGLTQMQSLAFLGTSLEIHHLYPVQVADDDNHIRLLCRSCHSKYLKLRKSDKWTNQWLWQLIHNTSPYAQERYALGDRFALINIKR